MPQVLCYGAAAKQLLTRLNITVNDHFFILSQYIFSPLSTIHHHRTLQLFQNFPIFPKHKSTDEWKDRR